LIDQPPVFCLFAGDIEADEVLRGDYVPVVSDEFGRPVFAGLFTTDIVGKCAEIVVIWR
jgi:hypothetical protein